MVPILSTDYFTKPEPQGSVSGVVARMMGAAGEALSKRVETYSAIAEAKLKQPAITEAYSQAYRKLAEGDNTGFMDMSEAAGLAAGNPMLSKMVEEANRLGISLANNSTKAAVAEERQRSQGDLANERFRHQEQMQNARFTNGRTMQEDRQVYGADQQSERLGHQDALNAQKENEERQKRNAQREAARDEQRRLSGDDSFAGEPLEPMLPIPQGSSAPASQSDAMSPMGLPIMTDSAPAASGLPASTSSSNKSAIAGAEQQNGNVVEPALPVSDSVPVAAPAESKSKPTPDLSADPLTSLVDEKQPTKHTADVKDSADVSEVSLGEMTIKVGKPKTSDKMKLKSSTVKGVSTTSTFEDPHFKNKEDDLKARDTFIESVGVMNTDPKASEFIIQNWGKTKNPQIGFEEIENEKNGKVTAVRMYGIDSNGNRIPYNNGGNPASKGDNRTPEGVYTDSVSKEFKSSYESMLKTKDKVNDVFGIKMQRTEKVTPPDEVAPIDQFDPALRGRAMEIHKAVAEKRMTPEQGKIELVRAQQEHSRSQPEYNGDKFVAPTDKEIESEDKKNNSVNNQSKIKDLEKEAAKLEKIINEGIPDSYMSENPQGYQRQLTLKEKKQYIIMRRNILDKIESLR